MTEVLEVVQQCAFFKIRKASRVVTQVYDRFLKSSGLAPTQFSLLVALSAAGLITVTQLAEHLVMDRTTLTRNLKPLEREGLIRVVPGPDRRTRAIALTMVGKKKLKEALPLWEKAQGYMAEEIGDPQWQHLRESLDVTVGRLKTDLA